MCHIHCAFAASLIRKIILRWNLLYYLCNIFQYNDFSNQWNSTSQSGAMPTQETMCFNGWSNSKMHLFHMPVGEKFKRITAEQMSIYLMWNIYMIVSALERYRKFNMWYITEKSIKRYHRDRYVRSERIEFRDSKLFRCRKHVLKQCDGVQVTHSKSIRVWNFRRAGFNATKICVSERNNK